MDAVGALLLAIAGIFVIGAIGEMVFRRTNIPDVVWLILAGIVIGPMAGLVTPEQLFKIAPPFAALTLIVILFEGGSRLRLDELAHAAPRSTALALSTFLLAVIAVALVSQAAGALGLFGEGWTWTHSFLVGTILGGSSSIIIMPAMAQAKVDPGVANLVNLESALTDALCVVSTSALIDVMVSGAAGVAAPALSLFKSFGIGLGIGVGSGLLWFFVLRVLRGSEHGYPLTLAALLSIYVLVDEAGGSAALAILAFAVLLGNAAAISRRLGFAEAVEMAPDVRGFHSNVAFIIKSFFFTFIGLMLAPPWSLIAFGVLLGAVLFGARIPAVLLTMAGRSFDLPSKKLVAVSMPRGMAAGVLATLPFAAGVPGTRELPSLVFACVITTIAVFAVGFPLARRSGPRPPGQAPGAPTPPEGPVGTEPPVPAAAEGPAATEPPAPDGEAVPDVPPR